MIDIEKFICDVYKLASVRANHELCHALRYAFSKQGLEYKDGKIVPIDNKPKFKVGDWIITNKKHIWYVDETPETTSYLYRLINQYGKVEVADFEDVDKKARLWTIQDAKDGDVLADNLGIILFKKIGNEKYKDVIDFYGNTNGRRFEKQEGFEYWGYVDCALHPATKEQRDTLYKTMHESGYEWDAEHKQLKKVEKKEELTEFENIVEEIADTSILNAYGVKELAKRLLHNANKQLQEEFDKQLELAYKNADKVQYKRGYRKAIEDAADFICNNIAGDDNTMRYFHAFMEQKLKELSQG